MARYRDLWGNGQMGFKISFLTLLLALTAWAAFAEVPTPAPESDLGVFRNTYYYVVLENDYLGQPRDSFIRDLNGEVIAHVSLKFRKALDIEGTGKLIDGRVVNFAGRVNNEVRYRQTDAAWGLGLGDCELVPFHSIAVDPTWIPSGALVRIEETVGMLLPDGTLHDGFWRADDIGGAIKRDRVDLFVGTRKWGQQYLSIAGITHLKPLTIRMITAPAEDSCVNNRLPTP